MSGTAPFYTQAFPPLPDRCFRLVAGGEGGGPTHCPEPPVWRGPYRAVDLVTGRLSSHA